MNLLFIALPVFCFIAGMLIVVVINRLKGNNVIKDASVKAEAIISKASVEAEIEKKSKLLEVKDEWFQKKSDFDRESQKRISKINEDAKELKQKESDLLKKAEVIEKRVNEISSKEALLASREKTLRLKDEDLEKTIAIQNEKLEKISGLTQEEAVRQLKENLESRARLECAQIIKEMKDRAKEEADKEAKKVLVQAIQRSAAEQTIETTVSVVHLPGDEMKGRIIGREGRNIRAFEEATGVDVIVDDTPEAVIMSGFDPVRREVARVTMEKLIEDGRIHPARIEELVKKAENEVEKDIVETGKQTAYDMNVHGLSSKIINCLGKLKFRTSYGQNVLQHSLEVAVITEMLAAELSLDTKLAKRAGLLHDIGKAIDRDSEGTHSELGARLAEKNGENAIIVNCIEAHHEDVEATSVYPILVQAADTISSTRPGARRETLSTYIKRLEKLEEIADSFRGVNKSYAIQAGREVRCIVEPDQLDDAHCENLVSQLTEKVQNEMEYPGQIKVTVVRETRFVGYAK
ncbi:MAG: ribonuclease Y [Fibrobacterota bacterium]